MVIINQLKTELSFDKNSVEKWTENRKRLELEDLLDDIEQLHKKAAKKLNINIADIAQVSILKHAIDARKKPTLFHVYTLGVELKDTGKEPKIVKRCKDNNVTFNIEKKYCFPKAGKAELAEKPVIIGTGPAGLFCGYMLAKYGYKPILLERGRDVEARTKDVEAFWKDGVLNPESNVQFGEGGAGTFSDGKLNTLVKDKNGRNKEVLRIFVECGAPQRILYESKPHIGTDILKSIVTNMRKFIIKNGGEVRFESKVTELRITDKELNAVVINDTDVISTKQAVLAIGHSARDTFAYLDKIHIPMEAKSFAVGLRVEHPQRVINDSMYGVHGNMLPAAPYKLTAQTSTGRGVYSFCMCPGGYVVNASSEKGRLAINGMSYSDRGSGNANSAIIVQVTPEDYKGKSPLAGIEFQRCLEEKAFALGKGRIPVQYYGHYVKNHSMDADDETKHFHKPCIKGRYVFANLRGLLPLECEQAFMEGMEQFGRKIRGFDACDTILSGIESRTSSPVRIHRDENLQSPSVKGLYPCGEGAGYAGGITSAAMDGILVAEQIAMQYKPYEL